MKKIISGILTLVIGLSLSSLMSINHEGDVLVKTESDQMVELELEFGRIELPIDLVDYETIEVSKVTEVNFGGPSPKLSLDNTTIIIDFKGCTYGSYHIKGTKNGESLNFMVKVTVTIQN
jgi:hypothetical protein